MSRTSTSRFLSSIPEGPVEDLVEDLERVRRARLNAEDALEAARITATRLAAEEAALLQLVAWARVRGGMDSSQSASETPGALFANGREDPQLRDTHARAMKRPEPKRALILAIMREQPERAAWTAREIRDELTKRGLDPSANLVRVTLRRMSASGQLMRLDDGHYKLAPADGAPDMGAS